MAITTLPDNKYTQEMDQVCFNMNDGFFSGKFTQSLRSVWAFMGLGEKIASKTQK